VLIREKKGEQERERTGALLEEEEFNVTVKDWGVLKHAVVSSRRGGEPGRGRSEGKGLAVYSTTKRLIQEQNVKTKSFLRRILKKEG